jgi:hypothetical protein
MSKKVHPSAPCQLLKQSRSSGSWLGEAHLQLCLSAPASGVLVTPSLARDRLLPARRLVLFLLKSPLAGSTSSPFLPRPPSVIPPLVRLPQLPLPPAAVRSSRQTGAENVTGKWGVGVGVRLVSVLFGENKSRSSPDHPIMCSLPCPVVFFMRETCSSAPAPSRLPPAGVGKKVPRGRKGGWPHERSAKWRGREIGKSKLWAFPLAHLPVWWETGRLGIFLPRLVSTSPLPRGFGWLAFSTQERLFCLPFARRLILLQMGICTWK